MQPPRQLQKLLATGAGLVGPGQRERRPA